MAKELQIAYFRDRAARNRLEGKSGALLDSFANGIEAEERKKERFQQELREDHRHQETLDELRQQREFLEAKAEEHQQQAEAANRAFQDRKDAKNMLEKHAIPGIAESVERIEGGAEFDYFDLVKAWHDLRAADSLYEQIEWPFLELKTSLTDLRKRVKRLVSKFKDESPPDTYLNCCDGLLQAANAVSWADSFHWDLNEKSFSSPADPKAIKESWRSTTGKIATYAKTINALVGAVAVAKELGVVDFLDDEQAIQFGNLSWFQSALRALALTNSCSPSLRGDESIESVCRYLFIARSQATANEHLARLEQKRDEVYASVVDELATQAELIRSSTRNPDAIEDALRNRPLRFVGIELVEATPTSFLSKIRMRIDYNLDARRQKARMIAEAAETITTELKQLFAARSLRDRNRAENTLEQKEKAGIAALDESGSDPAQLSKNSNSAQWEAILKASSDPEAGLYFITLLGSVYQAKRRDPSANIALPKLITLPQDQPTRKQQLSVLFDLVKDADLSTMSSMAAEIQRVRVAAAESGNRA